MSSINGVVINRGKLGVNVLDNNDAISGLLVNAPAITAATGITGLAIGKTITLNSLTDAENYGITAAYDATNNVRVHRHVSEFFRLAQEGTTLYLMLYTGTMHDALTTEIYAKQMLADAEGSIRQLAVAYNPATDYTATYVDGLEQYVRSSIPAAQELYEWAFENNKPCQIILEGRDYNATNSTAALNLRAIDVSGETMQYYKVSLCIGQDYTYAATQNAVGQKFADVGALLGSVSYMAVNHNVGEVENMNLTNTTKEKWITAGLSNHKTIAEAHADLQTLNDKGYIFALSYEGIAGKYWNDDHTCTPVIKDSDNNINEYCISFGRTHDKAVRLLRTVLLPKVKSTQPVDSSTGLLPQGVVKYFENIGDTNCFDVMLKASEISYGKTTVDPNSNLLVPPKELAVSFEIVPTGQVGVITGTINLKTSA